MFIKTTDGTLLNTNHIVSFQKKRPSKEDGKDLIDKFSILAEMQKGTYNPVCIGTEEYVDRVMWIISNEINLIDLPTK